jgi:hypothetical protein
MKRLYYRWTIVFIFCWENSIFCVTSHCVHVLCYQPLCPCPCSVLLAIKSVFCVISHCVRVHVLCYWPWCPCPVLSVIVSVSCVACSRVPNSFPFPIIFKCAVYSISTCQMQKQKSFACYYLKQPKSRFLNPHYAGASCTVTACHDVFRLHGRQPSRRSCRASAAPTFCSSEIFHFEERSKLNVGVHSYIVCPMK